jgi:hypothetical protein
MKRVACWDTKDVYAIVNPDVDGLDDFVFRAVHTDFPIQISTGRARGARSVSAMAFLAALLEPKDHVIVPVVGDSGTGKSHLVRWLHLQLRGSSDIREVIYVPKARTNLRDIVRSLVQRLPPEDQEPYLNALGATGSANLTSDAQRTAILNQIHVALVNDQGGASEAIDPELEEHVLQGLRAMFSDPHIRKSMLINKGFAAELASHIFEKPENYNPTEERREFSEKDLPLQVGDLRLAARETQDFLSWLMGASAADRSAVISIVNRHIDWAIGNCLNITGDRLITLMLELRRHFRTNGRELVLLIEDFARLQGLDRALLQSILEQQSDLCVLRTVFASTSGFYESLDSTIKTRLTFVVDMDANSEKERPDLGKFVSRYMNALRWGTHALQQQWIDVQKGIVDFEVPTKCADCVHKTPCQSNFGAVDGVGLYPFTAKSIELMADRSKRDNQTNFNPREYLKLVVRPVANAANDLKEGHFPPPQLLVGLGGKQMPATQQSRLKRDDPQNWERRVSVLELWGGTHEVSNLGNWLHTAFDLPTLTGAEKLAGEQHQSGSARIERDAGERHDSPDPKLAEIQHWYEGRVKLSSSTAQILRDAVFAAIEEFIDWDDFGLARSVVCGRKAGMFKPGQISFQEQATKQGTSAIRLEIPSNWHDDAERLRTTLALQGLVEARSHGDWSFNHGMHKLACLLECLRVWSTSLLEQCQSSDATTNGSATSTLAFELRVTLHAISQGTGALTTDQEVLRAAFSDLPPEPPDFITPEVKDLITGLRQIDSQMFDVIRTRFTAMKGGSPGEFLDSAVLLPLAAALRRRRFLPQERVGQSGSDRRDFADPIRTIAKRMTEGFATALTKEAKEREALKQRIVDSFGDRTPKNVVVQCIQQMIDLSAQLDLQGKGPVLAAKSRFDQTDYAALMTALRSADSSKLDVRQIRSGVGHDSSAVSETISTATAFLERISAEIAGRLAAAGVEPEEKTRTIVLLKSELNAIGQLLARYQDGNVS